MNLSKIENVQPEEKPNSEQNADNIPVSPSIANAVLPAVLFEQKDDTSICLKCVDFGNYYHLFSDGENVNFKRFKKFKFGKTGMLWAYWATEEMMSRNKFYRDCILGRWLSVINPVFEVKNRTELLVFKNGR